MAERKTIGLVAACPFPSSQGSQVLIRHLTRSLTRRGHIVHIITYPFGEFPPDPDCHLHRAHAPIPYRKLDPGPSILKPLLDLMLLFKTLSVARREKIEILHGHNYEGILVARLVAWYQGIPSVYYCHSLLADELPTYFAGRALKRLTRWMGGLVDRITAVIPDHTIAVSPRTAEELKACGAKVDAVTCIPPGIDPSEWPSADIGSKEPAAGPNIVYAGNLARFQNIPHLLDVVRRVAVEFPSVTLTIVTPSDSTELLSLAGSSGVGERLSVITRNEFENIIPHLLRADVACSTRTMSTGFPIKNLNYMAAGLPLVCYESGAAGVVDGETGIVLGDNDIEAFAGAVLRLLRDPGLRRKMGDRAREIAFRDYNWDNLAARIEEIHDAIVEQGQQESERTSPERK